MCTQNKEKHLDDVGNDHREYRREKHRAMPLGGGKKESSDLMEGLAPGRNPGS